jgi:hypothetical protein
VERLAVAIDGPAVFGFVEQLPPDVAASFLAVELETRGAESASPCGLLKPADATDGFFRQLLEAAAAATLNRRRSLAPRH